MNSEASTDSERERELVPAKQSEPASPGSSAEALSWRSNIGPGGWFVVFNSITAALMWAGTLAFGYDAPVWVRPVFWLLLIVSPFACLAQFGVGIGDLASPGQRLRGLVASATAPMLFIATWYPIIAGAAWGRPLRVRGRQLHPNLREGSDWTRGALPDASELDQATRQALAALWLHDAQKEHASVPAFARISWMLAAVGAPADLVEWSHRAALEEVEHARLCFALAAGYGGRCYSVEPMPDLLLGGLDSTADPMVTLATESLSDGCQLEDFNADVALACAEVCQEPVTARVLHQIAREERSHAEFSWALLAWLLDRSPRTVRPAVEKTLAELGTLPRPTAVGRGKLRLVGQADPDLMRRHGRLPDERWRELWDSRLARTHERLRALLEQRMAA